MIPIDSTSHPYLAIAQHFGVNYATVLNYASVARKAQEGRLHHGLTTEEARACEVLSAEIKQRIEMIMSMWLDSRPNQYNSLEWKKLQREEQLDQDEDKDGVYR